MKYTLGVWIGGEDGGKHWFADGTCVSIAARLDETGWFCMTPDGLLMPGACGPERGAEGRALAGAALEAWIAKQPPEPDLAACRRLLAAFVVHRTHDLVEWEGDAQAMGVSWVGLMSVLGLPREGRVDDVARIARGEA